MRTINNDNNDNDNNNNNDDDDNNKTLEAASAARTALRAMLNAMPRPMRTEPNAYTTHRYGHTSSEPG